MGQKTLHYLLLPVVLSKLGKYFDKLYKNYKNSGSMVKVAQEEYDTLKKDLKFEKTAPKQS